MANPLLIGGLAVAGAVAAWRLAQHTRRRLRTVVERITLPRNGESDQPIPLEQDAATGIYRPVTSRERPADKS